MPERFGIFRLNIILFIRNFGKVAGLAGQNEVHVLRTIPMRLAYRFLQQLHRQLADIWAETLRQKLETFVFAAAS